MNKNNAKDLLRKRSLVTCNLWILIIPLMVCLSLMSAYPAAAARPLQEEDYAAVDAYIAGQVASLKIPGLALAIVKGDQVAYVNGYGQAGPNKGPVTPQTSFMIGSATKSFTALAIMQLVEAGQINLEVISKIPSIR